MVQIERSFLSSCVARRIFFLFILCALLPVGVLSLISFGDVTSQLTEQSERRVRQESKAMGMAIYQRLLLAEAELRSSAWESGLLAGPSHEAASKSGRAIACDYRNRRGWRSGRRAVAGTIFVVL